MNSFPCCALQATVIQITCFKGQHLPYFYMNCQFQQPLVLDWPWINDP